MGELSTQERFKRGAVDAPRYFRFMADFVGFTPADAQTIRETRSVVEKHLPTIIAEFYAQLLRFPETRKHFMKKDGSVDEDYLELRMQHQANFWRRTMTAVFDEDYARFVDYIGRAHTSQGADPHVYISERYVIGMVGFVQQQVAEALASELHTINPDLESRGLKAWSALLTVLTEQLSRVYGEGNEPETYQAQEELNEEPLHEMAEDSYERASGLLKPSGYHRILVGPAASIADGERKIVQAEDHSIGVFHMGDLWYALSNSCLHRGGPVCTGTLEGTTLTCPWHGYQYDIRTGELLLDHTSCLPTYKVLLQEDQVYVEVPVYAHEDEDDVSLANLFGAAKRAAAGPLPKDAFHAADLRPGHAVLVEVDGEDIAVFNVDGAFYAAQSHCTHADGPLNEGDLDGCKVTCPWHASVFNVCDGSVLEGPASDPLKTYKVVIEGETGRVAG